MSILSLEFLVLLFVLLLIYYCIPIRFRWIGLLAASMAFYAAAGLPGLIYLGSVTLITWLAGLYMGRSHELEKAAKEAGDKVEAWRRYDMRRRWLRRTVMLVIGGMVFIKYFGIIYTAVNAIYIGLTSSRTDLTAMTIIVPLGLSYFTFQSVGYVIDCARGKAQPERNPLKYLLFVSFFPQITQGPITSYKQLMPQLNAPAPFEPDAFTMGFQLLLWGYFKKMVVADRLAYLTNAVITGTDQRGWFILLGAACYAVRLYADFSGGMDVIRGAAKMLGVDVVENFRRPFFSTSVAEYWRRWHISLGAWFRSYLFYPLTTSALGLKLSKFGQKVLGKKVGRLLPGVVGTFLIFFLIGIWHVANWNAVIYGAYFGFLLSASMVLEPILKSMRAKRRRAKEERARRKAEAAAEKAALAGIAEVTEAFEPVEAEVAAPVPEACQEPQPEPGRFIAWLGRAGRVLLNVVVTTLRLVRTWVLIVLPQYFAFTAGPKEGFALLAGTFRNWSFADVTAPFIAITDPREWYILIGAVALLLVVDILCECGVKVNEKLSRTCFLLRWPLLIALILAILLVGCYGADFDASAFLYMQF